MDSSTTVSTDGIDISSWRTNIPYASEEQHLADLSIWDFAGV